MFGVALSNVKIYCFLAPTGVSWTSTPSIIRR